MASSLGKAFVEVEANADKVGPEIEARFTAALSTIADAAEDVFDETAQRAQTAADDVADALGDGATEGGRRLGQLGDRAREAGQDVSEELGDAGRRGGKEMGESADREGSALVDKVKQIAVAAAAAFGAAFVVDQYLQLDNATASLEATLGTSSARAGELGQVAAKVYGQAWGENLGEVGGAVDAVVSSIGGMRDASSADIEGLTTTALAFAQAFGTDVAASAQTAGQLISNGLAKDGTQAFDLLTASFQRVPAAMREELPAILNEYGTNFRALGFSGEQAFGLLTGAAKGGAIVLDKTGDALKELTINGIDLGKNGEIYKQLGLDAEEMANAIAAGGPSAQDATQKISAAILDIEDPAARATAAISFFGTPLEDLSVDQVPAFLSAITGAGEGMTDAAGSAGELADSLGDTMQGKIDTLKRGVSEFAVNSLGSLIQGFQDGKGSGEGLTLALTTIGAAVAGLVGWIRDVLIPVLQGMAEWIGENKTAILIVVGVIAAVFLPHLIAVAAQSVLTKAAMGAMWLSSKVGAIQAAAAHSLSILRMIGGYALLGVQAAIAAAKVVGGWILMGLQATLAAARVVGSLVLTAGQFVIQGAIMAASMAATVVRVVAGWVLMGAQAMLAAARMAAAWFIALGPIGWIIAAVIGLVALIIANWDTVKKWTIDAFNAIVEKVTGAFRWIVDAVSSGISNVVSFVTGLPGKIVSAIGNFGRLLFDKGKELMQGLVDGIAAAASFVGNVAKNIVNAVIGFVNRNIITGINNLLEFTIAGIHINPPDIPKIPLLAEGAIVNRPTLAVVGEDGPEVVLPLSARRAGRRQQLMDQAGLTGEGGGGLHVDARQYYEVRDSQTAEEVGAVVGQRVVRDIRNGVASRYGTGAAA